MKMYLFMTCLIFLLACESNQDRLSPQFEPTMLNLEKELTSLPGPSRPKTFTATGTLVQIPAGDCATLLEVPGLGTFEALILPEPRPKVLSHEGARVRFRYQFLEKSLPASCPADWRIRVLHASYIDLLSPPTGPLKPIERKQQ